MDDRTTPETILDAERDEQRTMREQEPPGDRGIYVSERGWADTPSRWEIYAEDEDR